MDDIVKAAIRKWPNVPHCHGWLGLDARGDWYLRDEPTQRSGPFPQAKGSRVTHGKLKEFIGRNYEHDDQGQWFFQNGPQRVYVWLEAAPWVIGVMADVTAPGGWRLETHTGLPVAEVRGTYLDEQGRLFLLTEHGLGVVRSMDMVAAAEAMDALQWQPEEVVARELLAQQPVVLNPRPAAA
jgi:hypothetical protein